MVIAGWGFAVNNTWGMPAAIGLWSGVVLGLLIIFLPWSSLRIRLAFVKIEVQSSGIMGVHPPLPDSLFGKTEPLQVKFRLSSWLKVHPESAVLYVRKNGFTSINFYQEDGGIFGASFAIPINWFKRKTNKAYMIVSAKGREWRSKEFEIKVAD